MQARTALASGLNYNNVIPPTHRPPCGCEAVVECTHTPLVLVLMSSPSFSSAMLQLTIHHPLTPYYSI